MLQMSMYVDSLMMAEMVSRNMQECKNKFIVQWLVVQNLHIVINFILKILAMKIEA
jgi:hypothetical protein